MKNRNTYQSSTSQSCSVLLPVGRTSQLLQETNGKSPTMINISKVVLVKKKNKKKKKKNGNRERAGKRSLEFLSSSF